MPPGCPAASCPCAAHLGCAQSLPPPVPRSWQRARPLLTSRIARSWGGPAGPGVPGAAPGRSSGTSPVPAGRAQGISRQENAELGALGESTQKQPPQNPEGWAGRAVGEPITSLPASAPALQEPHWSFTFIVAFFWFILPFSLGICILRCPCRARASHGAPGSSEARRAPRPGCPPPSATLAQGRREP